MTSSKKYVKDFMGELNPLPRAKSIPKINALTKWQKFALNKGIQNKKKDRMLKDDVTGEYLPRYGGKSIKKTLEDRTPIIEYNTSTPNILNLKRKRKDLDQDFNMIKKDIPEVDPFTKKTKERKVAAKKENKKYDINTRRQDKVELKSDRDNIDSKLYMMDKTKHNQTQIQSALRKAQKSTNSAGK